MFCKFATKFRDSLILIHVLLSDNKKIVNSILHLNRVCCDGESATDWYWMAARQEL